MQDSKTNYTFINRRAFFKKALPLVFVPFLPNISLNDSNKSTNKAVKVLTCNIRVDLPDDASRGLGWGHRKDACIQILKRQRADIIGFQEVLGNQFKDLKASLSDYYAFGFDGPEMDKHKEGYHGIAKNPIFFSKKRFELLTASTYWLSETPLVAGSISWSSARARNAGWVRLYDKVTKKELRVVNLHLDHVNDEAKKHQIQVVLDEASQYQNDFPQLLLGDFNADMYSAVIKNIEKAGWIDTFREVNSEDSVEGTTHGFKGENYEKKAKSKKIDFIFHKGPVKTLSSKIIKDHVKGIYPSDHYFLSAEVLF